MRGPAALGIALALACGAALAASEQAQRFAQVLEGGAPAPRAYPDAAWVSLLRGACYGTCPVYTVRVDGAGQVEFRGLKFVCAKGLHRARVPREAAQRLLAAIDDAGFADMPDYDRFDYTDAPANLTWADFGAGRVHAVRHYDGMRDVPDIVDAIEDAVDRVSRDARWLPAGPAPRACTRRDGSRYTFDFRGRPQPLPRTP